MLVLPAGLLFWAKTGFLINFCKKKYSLHNINVYVGIQSDLDSELNEESISDVKFFFPYLPSAESPYRNLCHAWNQISNIAVCRVLSLWLKPQNLRWTDSLSQPQTLGSQTSPKPSPAEPPLWCKYYFSAAFDGRDFLFGFHARGRRHLCHESGWWSLVHDVFATYWVWPTFLISAAPAYLALPLLEQQLRAALPSVVPVRHKQKGRTVCRRTCTT